MIVENRLTYLKDIDIKCFEHPWNDEYWEKEIQKSLIKLWVDNNLKIPRGFAAYRFINIRDLIKSTKEVTGTVIHLLKLAVHPGWKRQGIGTKLLKTVEESAKLQKVVFIATIIHEENREGIDWLTKRKFVGYGVHRKMYPDERDGFGFLKRIEP